MNETYFQRMYVESYQNGRNNDSLNFAFRVFNPNGRYLFKELYKPLTLIPVSSEILKNEEVMGI